MDKPSETSLRKMPDELQPDEPVAESVGGTRAVVEAPDALNKSMGKFRGLLPTFPMGFFDGLLHN